MKVGKGSAGELSALTKFFRRKEVNAMPQREAILSIVAQIAPDKVDAVASLLPQAVPTRRRKGGTLVSVQRDEALAEEFRRQQELRRTARELERQELRRTNESATTIFVYDERIKFRKQQFASVDEIQLQKLDSFGKWVEFWRCFGSF